MSYNTIKNVNLASERERGLDESTGQEVWRSVHFKMPLQEVESQSINHCVTAWVARSLTPVSQGGGGVTFILFYLVITVRLILFALDWVRLRFGLVFVLMCGLYCLYLLYYFLLDFCCFPG